MHEGCRARGRYKPLTALFLGQITTRADDEEDSNARWEILEVDETTVGISVESLEEKM